MGRLMLLSILSLTLTKAFCAGFQASLRSQLVTGNQQEKALGSLNVPENLPETVLENLKEKLSVKKTWMMTGYSLYMAWAGMIKMKYKKSSSEGIRHKFTRWINKNSMFS